MKLYFLRHGIAEDRQPGRSDAERRLTPEGEAEMRRVARGMKRLGVRLDAVISSPLVRARQTADFVAAELDLGDRLREDARIGGAFTMGALQDMVGREPAGARLLFVGHEPDFSTLVGALIGPARVRMKKASLACVDAAVAQPGGGELRWLLEAEHLAAIGEDG